jgi:hypothetical protein
VTPFEQWLSDATRGLSTESAARVRAEIQQHYDSACEAGGDALAELGDPRAANRAYRKVLLTEQEALMAPVLTHPKRPSLRRILVSSALLAVFVSPMAGKHHVPGFWPITITILCTLPVAWFFPQTTIMRSRIWICVSGVRSIVIVAIFCWCYSWLGALPVGAVLFLLDYFISYRRLLILRKLATGQTCGLLPGEPQLTHLEAIHLRTLRQGHPHENVSIAVLFLMLAGMTVWMPGTFAPMAIWTVAGYLTRRTLPIYTEAGSRWLRIARWTTMVVAAVLPALYGARAPWIGAAELAFFFVLLDKPGISLRRKLPMAQWPKRLYW